MGDMREIFDAMRDANRERKTNNKAKNMDVINKSGITYRQDQNGTVLIKTNQGTVCFYPTTNKFMLKNRVHYGNAENVLGFIKNINKAQK